MGPDDDVGGGTSANSFLNLARVLGGDEPQELSDPDRQPGKALGEAAVVLAREQGRRHDDPRPGRPRHGRDKGGGRNAISVISSTTITRWPRIAADQPVHRLARRHVGQGVGDRCSAGPRFRDRESGRQTPRKTPSGGVTHLAEQLKGAPAARPSARRRSRRGEISSPAMSRMRCLTRARRDCQARPPSRSSCTPGILGTPKRDKTSMFSTGTNSLSSPA